jgi:iron-sulfur cluster assembly accessory protein
MKEKPNMPITVTEKAAGEVKKIITEQRQASVPPDLMPTFKALEAATGRAPTAAEMAEKLGITQDEFKTRLGQGAAAFSQIHLRMRVVGGGCSGFQHKLDLDPEINPKLDEVFEFHGVPVVVDKRSLMYLDNATVDFHDDLNKRGFSITNPSAKSTCGCGSSFSM